MNRSATHPTQEQIQNSTLNRRTFLKRTGAATLVLFAGGGAYRAADQGVFASGQGAAYEPWRDWQSAPESGPLRLVQSALLASNPHNTQPWLFRVREDSVELFADTQRHLGAMDPFLREMHLGLGCALENMMLTARAEGYEVDLRLESGALTGPSEAETFNKVATLNLLLSEAETPPLYSAIPARHTDRSSYAPQEVEAEALEEMTALTGADTKLFLFQEGTVFTTFVEETVKATETIIADEVMSRDSHAWFDKNWQEVQREKDGPFIDTAGVSPLLRAAVKMLPPTSDQMIDDGWLSGTRTTLAATPVLGLLAVRDLYDRPQTLNAGRVWQRLHLWMAANGLAAQPVNQMIEVVDRERQLGQPAQIAEVLDVLTKDPTWRPTFAFRMGYPTSNVLPSARRPVSEVLV